ncbi:hypothetical protein SUGI_1103070 [Cryptomeria japonica]|nr:hypothetical protein SUGI_1103070 [Cryptomeria japonica]
MESIVGNHTESHDLRTRERQCVENSTVNEEFEEELNADSDMDDSFEEFQAGILEERGLKASLTGILPSPILGIRSRTFPDILIFWVGGQLGDRDEFEGWGHNPM